METLPPLDLIHYVLIFGLAELYLMTLILAVVFWIKWRRLRRDRQGMAEICAAMQLALDDEIKTLRAAPLASPAIQQRWLAWLESWTLPFRTAGCGNVADWQATLDNLHRLSLDLANALRRLPAPAAAAEDRSGGEGGGPQADIDLDDILASHQRSLEVLAGIGQAHDELTGRCVRMRQTQQDLRVVMAAPGSAERDRRIRELLDQIDQDQDELLAMTQELERQRRGLESQLEELRQYIESLEIALGHQRRLMHRVLLERDSLAEENKVSSVRLEESVKLVGRLNRTLNALQREYEKLYEMRVR